MTKRYYNENPQVTMWREQAFKNQELFKIYQEKYDFAKDYNKRIVGKFIKLREEAERFNALPWWKKMFFNFKF